MPQFFCSFCFAKVEESVRLCAHCGIDIEAHLQSMTYEERLVNALRHPLSEARMSSILTLANRLEPHLLELLLECAQTFATDVVQNLEILRAIAQADDLELRRKGLLEMSQHESLIIRNRAKEELVRQFTAAG